MVDQLNEGQSYMLKALVQKVKPAATIFNMVAASAKKTYFSQSWDYVFQANETKEFDGTLTSVIGDAPDSGTVVATLSDLKGNILASVSLPFSIIPLPIKYGATITFN